MGTIWGSGLPWPRRCCSNATIPTPRVSGRKERLHRAYEEAAEDHAFQAEMAEIDRAFGTTVADGLEPFDPPV
jgi:hypothetical protein